MSVTHNKRPWLFQKVNLTQDAEHRTDLSNKSTPSQVRPSRSVVGEFKEHLSCSSLRSKNQDRDHDGEECPKVTRHKNSFRQRKMLRTKHIEASYEEHSSKDKQCSLPSRGNVCVFLVNDDERLHNDTDKPAVESDNALP
jgi:hypothetical protein